MPDNLTLQLIEDLKRRNKLPTNLQPLSSDKSASRQVSLYEQLAGKSEAETPSDKKAGVGHFLGAAVWHALDVGLLGLPGITLGEEAPYQWDELGGGAKAGAVLGEALGFLAPVGLIGRLTSKGVAAVGKYGTKAATTRAVRAAKSVADAAKYEDAAKIGPAVSKVFTTKAAKSLKPHYEISTATLDAAQKEMSSLIKGSLKKEFPTIGDDLVDEITKASLKGLSQKGVHVNSIGKWVERSLNTKFSIADRSKITAYIGRAAELTATFSIYNLIDDGIKSVAVEGHEFDPIADIGQALMFSAFLPAVEAIPFGGKYKFFKTRKDVKSGLDKIRKMDYDNLDVKEINALFKILSNNNRLQHSSFAVEASKRVGNAFKVGEEAEAALHLRALISNFKPAEVYREMYKEFGMDLIQSIPRMTIGAAYFNASTFLDANMLRNVDPEVLGAHLLVGALFTRRYKPIIKEQFPTLNNFDRKVEFLRTIGFEADQIKYLGEAYGLRADLGHAYTGLLNHPIMRQINEAINTGENKKQSIEGKDGVGELNSDVHSLVQRLQKLYILSENSRKVGLEDSSVEPDVRLNRLTGDQLLEIDKKLRKIQIADGEFLNEQNVYDFYESVHKDIADGTYQTYMSTILNALKDLNIRADYIETSEPFDITQSIGIAKIKGLKGTDGDANFDPIRQLQMIINQFESLSFVHEIILTAEETKMAKDIDSKKMGPVIQAHLDKLTKKISEDNYEMEDGIVLDLRPEENQFLNSLKNYKRERSLNALYNFVEGRTDKLTEADMSLYNDILLLIPEGSRYNGMKMPKDMDIKKWQKILTEGDFLDIDHAARSLSEMLNISSRGELKELKELDYEEVKGVVNNLKRNGFKIDVDMARTFEDFYYKRLLSSMDIGAKHIAIVENGLAHKAMRLEEKDGKRILVVQDRRSVERTLSKDMSKEELKDEMAGYDAIMSELKAINGAFMRVESEMPISDTASADLHSFIYETRTITSKFDKDVPGELRKVKQANNDRIEVIQSVDTVIEDLFDITDPDNPVPKKLTVNEVGELIVSLSELKKESENNMSPEMINMVDQLIQRLSLKNVGEDGMMSAHGEPLLALRNSLTPEYNIIGHINDTISKIIFGYQNYAGDKIQGRRRMDRLVANLTKQLRDGGIEVTNSDNLSQMVSKYFNSGLNLEQKIRKGIKLSLEDFATELNNHVDAWNSSLSDAEYFDGIKMWRDSYGDSSLKDKNVDIFAKSGKEINRLSEHNSYFKPEEFLSVKEELRLSLIKEKGQKDPQLTVFWINRILGEAESAYNIMHRDSPKKSTKEFDNFKHSVLKELLYASAGARATRSVKLKYAGTTEGEPVYLLTESKMVTSNTGVSEVIREFEEAGVYVALVESEGIILGENGIPKKVSNIFAIPDVDIKYFNNANLQATKQSTKERQEKGIIKPRGPAVIRIPISFNTQLIVDSRGLGAAKEVLRNWYNDKLSKLEVGREDGLITKEIIDNFKSLFSVIEKEGEWELNPSQLEVFVSSMYWDKMNSAAFNRIMKSPTTGSEINPIMARLFKYLSLAEGVGAKISGNETALRAIKRANEDGKYAGELLTVEQSAGIDYYIDKGKLEIVSIQDEQGHFDSLMITEAQLKELSSNPNLKADADHTRKMAVNLMKSLKGKSGIDAATYVGTHMWNLSLLQEGRESGDGSGGVKQSVAYNDGINTVLLKQNFTFDPNVAAIMDGLKIDILTFNSAAKEYSKEQVVPDTNWEGESLPIFFSRSLGVDAKKLRTDGKVQEIGIENIMFVKSEDRHAVTNISYAVDEYLNSIGHTQFMKDYANYDGILSKGEELRKGILSRGSQRLGMSDFILNTLAEEGSLIDGSTNAFVKVMVQAGVDPKSAWVKDDIGRIVYRTIINRIRKPQTTGGSYATMIPYLEGSVPVYNNIGQQVRFGGKKLPFADSNIVIDNMDKLQYIVDIGGRQVLIGKNAGGEWAISNIKKSELKADEVVILKDKIKTLDIINKSKDLKLGILYNMLKPKDIWLESLSLRMPNLAADIAIHKIEGFYSFEMGNVVGVNVLDLATKHQGDFDADMLFSYHDTKYELTDAVAELTPRRMDAYVYEPTDFDFKDIFSNGETLKPAGSLTNPIKRMDDHIINYNVGKNHFGQIKRLSAGINSLNRINMNMDNVKMLKLEGEKFNAYLQRYANNLQSLIDTTTRSNLTNKSTVNELKRYILFGDTIDKNIKLEGYNERGYKPLFELDGVKGYEKDVYKDAIIEMIDALGRPSRVMSDLFDGSGRRIPDQNDLVRMRQELDQIAFNPNQFIFNRLIRRYKKGDPKRDALLKMFYETGANETTDVLRQRILKGRFKTKVMVEKTPFVFLGDWKVRQSELYDSTPAGYALKRIGNVKNTYDRAASKYGVETKDLAKSISTIENFIALSDAETHAEIMEALEEADGEGQLMFGLTGGQYETKITDLAYAQKYSVAYALIGKNAASVRNSLRRNGSSSSSVYLTQKLHRLNAIMEHMRKKEDGFIGKLLEGKHEKSILDYFKFQEYNIGKSKFIPNYTNNVNYIYRESSVKGKWQRVTEIRPKSKQWLSSGRYLVLKNPLRYDLVSKSETIDAYSLLSVFGEIEANNIRGFSGETFQEITFINDSRSLKAQISALSSETYRKSEGHPEAAENWGLLKEFEDKLVDDFMKKHIPDAEFSEPLTSQRELNTIHDIIGYMIKPDPMFGNITYAQDRNVALPSFKINKRVSKAMLRWLVNNGHEELYQDIAMKYGSNFRRRYDNVPDLEYTSMYSDGIYRERNTPFEGKSEVYNMIADTNPDFLYTPAISEVLKNEMTFRSAKTEKVRDPNGNIYSILRFGKYDDIEVGLDVFADPKSKESTTNLECY
jgi:hypothetical protein